MKQNKQDQWDEIHYPTLTDRENEEIRAARRNGFCIFYPNSDKGDNLTLVAAREFKQTQQSPLTN